MVKPSSLPLRQNQSSTREFDLNRENVPAAMINHVLSHGQISIDQLAELLTQLSGKPIEVRNIISIKNGVFSVKTWLFIPLLRLALLSGWIPQTQAQWQVVHLKVMGANRALDQIDPSAFLIKLAEIAEFSEQQAFDSFIRCRG